MIPERARYFRMNALDKSRKRRKNNECYQLNKD